MKNIRKFIMTFLLLGSLLTASFASETSLSGVLKDGSLVRMEIPVPGVIHVSIIPTKGTKPTPFSVVLPELVAPAQVIVANQSISDGTITATLTDKGQIVFSTNEEGETLFTQESLTFQDRSKLPGIKSVNISWNSALPDALYGLGQYPDGRLDMRGITRECYQDNRQDCLPVWVSSAGWGVLWDNPAPFIFTADEETGMSLNSENGGGVNYFFMVGPSLDQVIGRYRTLTGGAPLPPKWALGYQQCKERYETQQEVQDVAAQFRTSKFPVDTIIQDWRYWVGKNWSSMVFDSKRYPDPAGMVEFLHDRNFHVMISVFPMFAQEKEGSSALYTDLEKGGYLATYEKRGKRFYNVFDEKARSIVWEHANKNLFSLGIDGWWLDGSEAAPLGIPKRELGDSLPGTVYGPWQTVSLAYPFFVSKSFFDGQRAANPDKRVFILTRSTYAGIQRFGSSVWTGDNHSDWETLRLQVPEGIGYCLSGAPYWNTDIGGFQGTKLDTHEDPEFRELFVRWFQFGAFCPEFRAHGTGTPREPWQYGEPGEITYDTLLRFANLRYRMMPYLYSMAWDVTQNHSTMLRALSMDFQDDPKCWSIGDQYMFGPSLLVAPVTAKAESTEAELPPYSPVTREVYLPAGTDWYDFWTGERHSGGQTVTMTVPLDQMPLFLRGGSILAMGPKMQWVDEIPTDPLELRIAPGADAHFEVYQDAGDGYGYTEGESVTIPVHWDDNTRTVTVGDRKGNFPGMMEQFNVHVVIVREGHGTGVESLTAPDVILEYKGEAISQVID
ncbi:glycoside hydrolase family 31 protein [Coraliomargarita sp. W4R53]